jgi:MFS family permease
MVQDLHDGDDTDASFYAGLLVSAYAVAEALTAMTWGSISDRYGRKPVVLIGLGGVALSCLIFGLAQQYWVALLARFVGGALNGNVAVMQTMVAEMVKKPEHERKSFRHWPALLFRGILIKMKPRRSQRSLSSGFSAQLSAPPWEASWPNLLVSIPLSFPKTVCLGDTRISYRTSSA